MFEVRVETDFAAAHFLRDYNGKCENLHGHNYKVFAHIRGTELNEGGMLLDFTRFKKVLKEVCNGLDHINLNDIEYFQQNPSAEKIALYIYTHVIENFKTGELDLSYSGNECRNTKGPYLYSIDVFETDRNRATYSVY